MGAQTSITLGPGYAGLSSAFGPAVVHRVCDETIPFGRVVEEGASSGTCALWNTGTKSALGISQYNKGRMSAHREGVYVADSYVANEGANVQTYGAIMASVDGTGVVGAALTVIDSTGQLSTASADGTHTAVNAVLESACAVTNDVVMVRFNFDPLITVPLGALPLHHTTHENNGADEINATGLVGIS